MSKTIGTSLQTDIRRNVTTLALAVTIRRRDGRVYRFTNHDSSVTLDGVTYASDIAFDLPSIDSSSQLAIDNTQLVLYLDGTTFVLSDFENRLYDNAECEIALFDYENPSHGSLSLRKGWFGEHVRNSNDVVKVTVTGLMKLLDFEIGRTYQAACDATLGDKRCRVAIDQAQIYSLHNPYKAGDWVYRYDPALMTAIPLVNASFDVDGVRSTSQTITGWTRGPGTKMSVAATSPAGALAADSTYALYGDSDASSVDGFEHYVYQDITTATIGMANADIDEGKLSLALFALIGQYATAEDPLRFKVECFNAAGQVIDTLDSRYQFLDTVDVWRERAVAGPVIAGTRSLRVTLYMRRESTSRVNAAFDTLRAYYWDHTLGTPYSDVVYRLRRIVDPNGTPVFRPYHASFEFTANNAVSSGSTPPPNTTDFTGYVGTAGSWWKTTTSAAPLSATDGSKFLKGGDDGSSTQRTDVFESTFQFNGLAWQPRLNLDVIDAGLYYVKIDVDVGFTDTTCQATIEFEQLNETFTPITSEDLVLNYNPGSTGWQAVTAFIPLVATARMGRLKLSGKSASGSGNNGVAFDNMRYRFFNIGVVLRTDPPSGFGSADTVWDDTPGAVVIDNGLVWQAVSSFVKVDVVATVVDRRTFTGTTIAGVDGTYETGYIRWLSGQNVNQINLIRQWTSGTKTVKTYFRAPYPIQVGDRFMYVRSCQRRFAEDCRDVFSNSINFRGFPYIPGKLTLQTS